MRTIYHLFIVFTLLVSPLSDCLGQWSQIKQEWCPQGEFSGPYLFFHSHYRTQPFIRLDLRDTTFQTELVMTKVNGDTFSGRNLSSGCQFAVVGSHLINTADSVVYISHDYGTTWDSANIPVTQSRYNCFGSNGVFGIAAGSYFYYSLDSGHTFKETKLFLDSNFEQYPLYLKDSMLLYQTFINKQTYQLNRIRLDGSNKMEILYDDSITFTRSASLAVLGNHLLVNLNQKVYLSKDGGFFWQEASDKEYFGLSQYNNYVLSIRHQKSDNHDLYFMTSDTFRTVQAIGPPSKNYAVNTGFYNGDFYTVGLHGIYRLKDPNIAHRQVRGTVFYDENLNGVFDQGESGIPNQTVRFKSANWSTISDSSGKYEIDLFYGADTVYAESRHSSVAVYPAYHVSSSGVDTVDFGYRCDTTKANVRIDLIGNSTFNKWRGAHHTILCTNQNGKVKFGVVRYRFKKDLSVLSVHPAPDRSTDSTFEWDVQLNSFEIRRFIIHLSASSSSTINSSDTLHFSAWLKNISDHDTSDNFTEMMQPVTSSYDPNDKSVSPVFIPWEQAGQQIKLKYTIRFQNTGTDTAFDVHIADTLSPLINPESLQILETSHRMKIKAEGNAIRFVFDDIYLPDSITNAKASQGYLTFTCETRMPIGVDEKVDNTAFIYFDGNEPIVTNTTTSVVLDKVGSVVSADMEYPVVYPNPTNGVLHLPNNTQSYEILDFNGKVLRTAVLENHTIVMDDLINGIYILRVQTEDGISMHRIQLSK